MRVKEESEKAGSKLNIEKLRSWHLVPSVQFSSVTQSCPTLCDPMNCSMPGLPVHHQLPELAQTHVHRVGGAIQPSHSLTYSFHSLEPVLCSMSSPNCCFLTCIQISQEAGKVVCYSHPLKNCPQFIVIHTIKGFSVVDEIEVDVFSGTLLLSL